MSGREVEEGSGEEEGRVEGGEMKGGRGRREEEWCG